MSSLTPRGRTLRWLTNHRYTTEQPPGSNTDQRHWGIRRAQVKCARGGTYLVGQPWCGVWAWMACYVGGVRTKSPERWASVAFIEDDARAKKNGFRGWTTNPRTPLRGDLVVLFGRGVHVGVVRKVYPTLGYVVSDEGNTSSGNAGSQDNGGGSYRRIRRLRDVHGFALVDYPNT